MIIRGKKLKNKREIEITIYSSSSYIQNYIDFNKVKASKRIKRCVSVKQTQQKYLINTTLGVT